MNENNTIRSKEFNIFCLQFFKSHPKDFSPNACWTCIDVSQGYLYISPSGSLFGLLKQIIFKWRQNKHFTGMF